MTLLIFSLSVVVFFGLPSNLKLVNVYWFPHEVRKYILPKKFKNGSCVKSKYWGVGRKKIVGIDYDRRSYLLMDMDRYEHLQYIKKEKVELVANSTFCL